MVAKDSEGHTVPVVVVQAWEKDDQHFGIGRVVVNDPVYPINTLILLRRPKVGGEVPTFEKIKSVLWEEF